MASKRRLTTGLLQTRGAEQKETEARSTSRIMCERQEVERPTEGLLIKRMWHPYSIIRYSLPKDYSNC